MIKLRQFQIEDLARIKHFGYRALVSLEMGLGKTVEALAAMLEASAFPTIVICLKGLKRQWAEMAWEDFGIKARILHGRQPYDTKALKSEQLIILNYDILPKWIPYLFHLPPRMVIIDESQLIGNMRSRRSYFVQQLCLKVPKLLCLSGTPFSNYAWEMYPTLQMLRSDVFDSPLEYGLEYCGAVEASDGRWNFSGSKSLKKLHRVLLDTCMIRRTFAEVASEVPPKTRQVVPLEIENRKEYDEAAQDVVAWLAKTDMAKAIRAARARRYTDFTYLKHLAAQLKLKPSLQWYENALNESDGKMLIGTIHKDILAPIHEKFKDQFVVIDGSKTEHQRDLAKRAFKESNDCRGMIIQMAAGGAGLNLPEASIVALAEQPWNPATCLQFEKRAHRLNSQHPVCAYYLTAWGTIEEAVCKLIQKKQKEADAVLDGLAGFEGSFNIFDELQALLLAQRKVS